MITEVLPDSHHRLWVTVEERTHHMQLHPLMGPDQTLPLNLPRVFAKVRVTEDRQGLQWPGGFHLPLSLLTSQRNAVWLTHLRVVPLKERYRPLLPLLRHATPGAPLRDQPGRHHVMQMFGTREGELDGILRAYPAPEPIMLHRLHDLGNFMRHHLFPELPIALLRRSWAYAAHRCTREQHLHTMLACLTWGRIDLIEDPLWALARAEAAG